MNVRADVNYLQNIRQLFIIKAMAWCYYDKKYPLLLYKFREMDGSSWYMFSIPVKNLVDVYKSYYGRLPCRALQDAWHCYFLFGVLPYCVFPLMTGLLFFGNVRFNGCGLFVPTCVLQYGRCQQLCISRC